MILDLGKKSRVSTTLYNQAVQLAKDAKEIADDIFKGTIDRHRIAVLMKGYAELKRELEQK